MAEAAALLWNGWHAAFGFGVILYAVSKSPPEQRRDRITLPTDVCRRGNGLGLWISVAMLAAMVDFAFGTIAAEVYSIAWYGGRLLDLVAGLIVPVVLARELLARFRLSVSANQELVSRSNTDGLTGLSNRRAFDQELEVEIRRARREATELSLLIVDLDHFKQVNDHFGHPVGDFHLIAVSQAMQLVVSRPADRVARFGGEEFAILLPRTGPRGAAHIAGLVREAIEALALPVAHAPSGCLTASVGVATLAAGDDVSASDLIEAADRAMYVAKGNGRNRVAIGIVAEPPVAMFAAQASP